MRAGDSCAALGRLGEVPGRVGLRDVAASLTPPAEGSDPAEERVRFVQASDLGFHGGEIVGVERRGAYVAVVTALPGLGGAETPLPLYLADDLDRDDEHGAAIRGLLDVVHHRMLARLLAGLAGLDLPGTLAAGPGDAWSLRLLALVESMGSALPPALRLRLLPVVAAGPRSAEALAAALRLALEAWLPASASLRVEPWTGGFVAIDPGQQSRLGEASAALDETALLGGEILHPGGAAEIVVGPLRGDEARAFARGEAAYGLAAAVCEAFAAAPLRFALVLEIDDVAYPPCLLGQRSLGEETWLSADERPGTRARRVVPLAGGGGG